MSRTVQSLALVTGSALIVVSAATALRGHFHSTAGHAPHAVNRQRETSSFPDADLPPDLPRLTLPTLSGTLWSTSEHRNEPLLLLFFCGCDTCRSLAADLHRSGVDSKVPHITAIVAGGHDTAERLARLSHLRCTIAYQAGAEAALLFDAVRCPQARFYAEGRLRYSSAREHANTADALRRDLSSLLAVRLPEENAGG